MRCSPTGGYALLPSNSRLTSRWLSVHRRGRALSAQADIAALAPQVRHLHCHRTRFGAVHVF